MARLTAELIATLVNRVSGPSRAIVGALGRVREAQARNARAMERTRGQMLDAAAAGFVVARALGAPIRAAIDFETAMADVRKVVDFPTPEAFAQMSKDIVALSTEIPIAADGIAQIVAAAGQAGMKGDELLTFAKMAAKVGVAFDITADQAGESLAKIKTALGLTVGQTSDLADAINHLSNTSASSAPDLLDFLQRVGASGTQVGLTAAQTTAIGSAMIASGATADVAATSFRNMTKALARGESATKRQRKAFKLLGLDAATVAKNMQKDAVGTLQDVLAKIRQLPDHMRASAISDLFGDEARAVMPLITNANLLGEALGNVADQAKYLGISVQKEYEARAATTENALRLLKNRMTALGIAIGSALLPAINTLVTAIGPMIGAFSDLAAANPMVTTAVVGLTAALVGLRVASIGLRYGLLFAKGGLLDFQGAVLGAFSKVASASKTGLNAVAAPFGLYNLRARRAARSTAALAAAQVAQTQKAYAAARAAQALARQGKLAGVSAIAAAEGVKAAGAAAVKAQKELMAANAALAAIGGGGAKARLLALLSPVNLVTAAFRALKLVVIGTGIGAVVVGLAAAGTWIHNNWSGLAAMFKGFGAAFTAALQPIMPALEPVRAGIEKISGLWSALTGTVDASPEKWASFGASAGKALGDFIVRVAELPGKISGAIASIDFSGMVQSFTDAGAAAGKVMIDAIISAFDRLWAWLAELPGKIVSAIGNIDVSNMITWPSFPWSGGGGSSSGEVEARARGGPVAPHQPYLVGERGPELIVPKAAGTVMTAARTARLLAAQRSSIHVPGSVVPPTPAFAPRSGADGQVRPERNARSSGVQIGSITFGDIHIPAAPGASVEEIKRGFDQEVSALLRSHFSDSF